MPYNFKDFWTRRRAPFRALWKIAFGGNIPASSMLSINIEDKVNMIILRVLRDYEEHTVGVRRITFGIIAASHLLYGLAVVYRKKVFTYWSQAQAAFIAVRQLRITLNEGQEQDRDQQKKKRPSKKVGYRQRLWANRLRKQRLVYTAMPDMDEPPAIEDNEQAIPANGVERIDLPPDTIPEPIEEHNEQAIPANGVECIDLPPHTISEDIDEGYHFAVDEDFGNLSMDTLLFHYAGNYSYLRNYWAGCVNAENQVPEEEDQPHPQMPRTQSLQITTSELHFMTPLTSTVYENLVEEGIHDIEHYNDLPQSESEDQESLQENESPSNFYPDVSDIVLPPLEAQPMARSRRRRIQRGTKRNAIDKRTSFPMSVLGDNIRSPQSTQRALNTSEDIILPNSLAYSPGTLLLKNPRKQILSKRIQTLITRNYCLPDGLGGQNRQYLGTTVPGQDHSHSPHAGPSNGSPHIPEEHGQDVSNEISIDEDIDMSETSINEDIIDRILPGTSGMNNRPEKKGTRTTILEGAQTMEWSTGLPGLQDMAGSASHFERHENDYQVPKRELRKRKVKTIKKSFLEICPVDSNNRRNAARIFSELLHLSKDKQVTLEQTAYNRNIPETAFAPIYVYKEMYC